MSAARRLGLVALAALAALVPLLLDPERRSGAPRAPAIGFAAPPDAADVPVEASRAAEAPAFTPLVLDDALPDEPFELEESTGTITGTVRLNGELEAAVVWCTPRGERERLTTTTRDGEFRFDGVPAGTVDVEASPSDWAREPRRLGVVGASRPVQVRAGEVAKVDLFLDALDVRFAGVVLHDDGTPAADWQVYVAATRGTLSFLTRTDSRGRFAVDVPDLGLRYRVDTYALGSRAVEAFPGESVKLTIRDLTDLVVRARDAKTSDAITKFEVDLRLPNERWQRPPRPERPGADGAFRWRTFVGAYDVLVIAPGHPTAEVRGVELAAGETTELDVALGRP